MASTTDWPYRRAVRRRNSIGIMSAYHIQKESGDLVQAQPEDYKLSKAVELLQRRGLRRSQHDLAKVAQARPCQYVQPMLWNPCILSAAQILEVGGEAWRDRLGSTPERSAAPPELPSGAWTPLQATRSESTKPLHHTVGGNPSPGDPSTAGRGVAAPPEPPPSADVSSPARAPATAPALAPTPTRTFAPVSTYDRTLASAVHSLDRTSQRRLARLDSLGIFTPRTNAVRVEAERVAQVRRCVAGHLDQRQREAVRKRLGLWPPLQGGRGDAGTDGRGRRGRGGGDPSDYETTLDAAAVSKDYQQILRHSASTAKLGAASPHGSRRLGAALAQARPVHHGAGPGAEHEGALLRRVEAQGGVGGEALRQGVNLPPARSQSAPTSSVAAAARGRAGVAAAVGRDGDRRTSFAAEATAWAGDESAPGGAAAVWRPVPPSLRAEGAMRGMGQSKSGANLVGAAGRGEAAVGGGAGMRRVRSVAVMNRPRLGRPLPVGPGRGAGGEVGTGTATRGNEQ